MKKPINRALLNRSMAPAPRMMGVVLPVVLVVLTVLTGLVVTQIRRSAVDERLAANTRESVQLDHSVQTVLRWCEARITLAPQRTATVTPSTVAQPPAWARASANWTDTTKSLDFVGGAAAAGTERRSVVRDRRRHLRARAAHFPDRPNRQQHVPRHRRSRCTLAQVSYHRARVHACAGHDRRQQTLVCAKRIAPLH